MNKASNNKDHSLDARGLFCPEPVMLLHKKIRELDAGELVKVIATDPSTTRDIPKFCHFLGHELLESNTQNGEYVFHIRKVDSSIKT
ncbi:MAG: sulfurtransferase TusA [Gammaproteobacteria bacterium]|jgi:tRNA 2-thiouridine synthesizing protein A|nr:sulfurtransferase TusA [Gammaproteobacteria bacterium]